MASVLDLSKEIQEKSDAFNRVMKACNILLNEASEARQAKEELNKRLQGQLDINFQFGYFPKDYELSLLLNLVDIEDLFKTDLIYQKYHGSMDYSQSGYCGKFSNHQLIMPYKNLYGDILGIVGRTLSNSFEQKALKISKYKNTTLPKSINLFGFYEAKDYILKNDSVIIVEGQFDCITSHRYGYQNTIALGSSTLTSYQFYLIKRYTDNIHLLLDNDLAGKTSVEKTLERFGKDANFNVVNLNGGYKDIDEYLNSGQELKLVS